MIEQISIFDLMQDQESRFTAECRYGSGFADGRVRIYCASCNLGVKELADFLKDEYGIGGHSVTFPDGSHGFADYRASGMQLWQSRTNWKENHSYVEMAREIKRLIFSRDYLTPKDEIKLAQVLQHFDGRAPLPHPRCRWEGIE